MLKTFLGLHLKKREEKVRRERERKGQVEDQSVRGPVDGRAWL
jgi:hypothetical protein